MSIENKIQEIYKEYESPIIILKGFDIDNISRRKRYFSFEIDYYDKVNLEDIEGLAINDILKNRDFNDDYLWMTIEEYQLFREHEKINNNPIILLENDLYNKQYPYRETLSNISNIYKKLYYAEDNELNEVELKMLDNVSTFYGQINYSKQSDSYYVTYPEYNEKPKTIKYFNSEEYSFDLVNNYPENNLFQIELSEDEIPFLDLTEKILSNKQAADVLFILSSSTEALPNHYLKRINTLSTFSNVQFYFTTISLRRNILNNEQEYLEILRELYGYDSYKEIEFYKSIENRDKETIKISQAQIIDDIVNQAEKAMLGDDFQDVYITASTGAGKSIMFQIPALYLARKYKDNKPLTLVISPLIGLMNDQVDSMKRKGIANSATINGNTPPFEKERILEGVLDKSIDILYLSPETLQARSDIKTLIGDREIGVVIIDEAHIVTTWGKSFRADYWYLGIYLAKLRKEYKFPIVTFTATAIYGGREDMYIDTRNSLNMISPISYFGKVRRDEIKMLVTSSDKDLEREGRDYRKTKLSLTLRHLINARNNKKKSLIYFPTVRLLNEFYNFLKKNEPEIADVTGRYFGNLQKEEKDEVLNQYQEGKLQFVLATKAFGMGIDIPDITFVYHYAPTGNVVDYIQEIGRAARDKDKVATGYGVIDFLKKDMNEVKQLHGMSAIRKSQIIEVMKKVLSIYKEKGNNRNLIISSEDFKYIFVQNKRDEDSLDNKVKTVLLMIEKDFSSPNKLGYSPFVARPRSLFGNDLIFVTPELEKEFLNSSLKYFFEEKYKLSSSSYSAVYQVNLSGIWERYYRKLSFPNFKRLLFTPEERDKLQHSHIFDKFIYVSGVEVGINDDETVESILSEYQRVLKSFESFVNNNKISQTQFSVKDLGNHFMKTLKISDQFSAMTFAQAVINAAFEFSKLKDIRFIAERNIEGGSKIKYIIHQDGDLFTNFILNSAKETLSPKKNFVITDDNIISFHLRSNSDQLDEKIAALGIGESKKLLNYQIVGGNNPQIYLRMNSVYPLEDAISKGDFYQNSILNDVQIKHHTSVEMLEYLFTKKQPEDTKLERIENYSKWFWDKVEDYFMGVLPQEVESSLNKSRM